MSNWALNSPGGPKPHATRGRFYALMLLVTVCWAANIVAGKVALRGFGPLALAQMRVGGTAAIYTLGLLAARGVSRLRLSLRQWLYIIAAAWSGVAFNQICFIAGLASSTVAHCGLIVALGPVMVLLIAVLISLETLSACKLVGMMIAFGGVGILTLDRPGPDGGTHWRGDMILLVGTVLFAIYTILMKELSSRYDALTLNALVFMPSVVFMAPFCTRQLMATRWGRLGNEVWWAWAFMVVCGSVVPYLLFAYVLKELAASRVAAFNYLQPVIASGLAAWVLAERLTLKIAAGGALILTGVYLTEREKGDERPEDARTVGPAAPGGSPFDKEAGVAGCRSND